MLGGSPGEGVFCVRFRVESKKVKDGDLWMNGRRASIGRIYKDNDRQRAAVTEVVMACLATGPSRFPSARPSSSTAPICSPSTTALLVAPHSEQPPVVAAESPLPVGPPVDYRWSDSAPRRARTHASHEKACLVLFSQATWGYPSRRFLIQTRPSRTPGPALPSSNSPFPSLRIPTNHPSH